jgi:hypothetical protein
MVNCLFDIKKYLYSFVSSCINLRYKVANSHLIFRLCNAIKFWYFFSSSYSNKAVLAKSVNEIV